MRLSIRWIFDHISVGWHDANINDLVKLLNKTTSEIESVEHIKVNLDKFNIVKIVETAVNGVKGYSYESGSEIFLPERKDLDLDAFYIVKKDHKAFAWATTNDFGSDKSFLLPSIKANEQDIAGAWKEKFEAEDYILTLDNKAITHRPDLWGHRGFAREISALIGANLLPLEEFISSKPVKQYDRNIHSAHNGPFEIELKQSYCHICNRFSGLYFSELKNQPSCLDIASRLCKVGAKPIDFIVDATNYVMFDLGQPIHAYDADKISSKKIVIHCAIAGDKFKLLDGSEVECETKDCIISDGNKPIALAGIMGGLDTAVSNNTKSIFLESANFDASAIRQSSMRLKKRTEASARFEKSLDPNQNIFGILRFINLLDRVHYNYKAFDVVTSLGAEIEEKIIKVPAELIKKILSLDIEPAIIERILTKIGFELEIVKEQLEVYYIITVPTFRATKDVTIPEDIVEEIGRFIGYEIIALELPKRVMKAFDFKSAQNIRDIKKHLAYALDMNEVQSYVFFDEEFLKELDYQPIDTLEVLNPQSENLRRLITSLIPNLMKVINTNKHKQELLRIFELNRVWFLENKNGLETMELAGIFFSHKQPLDFYECKSMLNSLFNILKINVKWHKAQKVDPWYNQHQTAELSFDNQVIGIVGMADNKFLSKIADDASAFIFELNADFLIGSRPESVKFVPLEKYPEVHFDISVLIPNFLTVYELSEVLQSVDNKIKKVSLVDYYEKEEWGDKKSLTFKIKVYDENKTLVKDETDQIYQKIVTAIEKLGGSIR